MNAVPPATIMQVLAISDNPELAAHLVDCWQGQVGSSASLSLAYTSSNRQAAGMQALGASPLDLHDESLVDALIDTYALIFSIHSKRIFPPRLVEKVRCINVHPGLNPHNRGWYPQVFTILNKAPIGATIHEMTAAIDAGPIIVQQEVEHRPWDRSVDLYRRVIEAEKALLAEWLPRLVTGDYRAQPPSDEGNYNSIADFKALCRLDPGHVGTLQEHIDLLLALSHPPFRNGFLELEDGRRIYLRLDVEAEEAKN